MIRSEQGLWTQAECRRGFLYCIPTTSNKLQEERVMFFRLPHTQRKKTNVRLYYLCLQLTFANWMLDVADIFNVYQYIIATMPSVEPQLWKICMPCWSDILINTHPNSDNSDQSQRLSCLFDNLTDRQELHVFTLVPNQSFWLQIMTHRDKKTTFSQRASWNDIRKT